MGQVSVKIPRLKGQFSVALNKAMIARHTHAIYQTHILQESK